ncbi:MAG TPA: creatininase family protein [Syntrophomonadaceae bacterium]|nr:creatininase family protein [Syntrophomonadaceae bacterium]
MSVWLQELCWTDVRDYLEKSDIIIIPVGSVEQHGNHLPLGTDAMVAITLAEDAAKKTGVLVAPPLWFGWSPHHMVLPGTITMRPEVLLEILYDIIDSLHKHGFNKFVVINGHRIVNIPWIQIASERAQRVLGVKIVLFDPAYMSKEILPKLEYGPVGHSEEIETSHMMYKYPKLVHLEKAQDNPPKQHLLYFVDPAYTGDTLCYIPGTMRDMKESAQVAGGTTGTPSKSSREKGGLYHRHLVENLVKVIEGLKEEKRS